MTAENKDGSGDASEAEAVRGERPRREGCRLLGIQELTQSRYDHPALNTGKLNLKELKSSSSKI